jgi:hypothetical protein
MIATDHWKRATAKNSIGHGEQIGVDLFDDERPGVVTVYKRMADGALVGCRDITIAWDKFQETLDAWTNGTQVFDHRTPA